MFSHRLLISVTSILLVTAACSSQNATSTVPQVGTDAVRSRIPEAVSTAGPSCNASTAFELDMDSGAIGNLGANDAWVAATDHMSNLQVFHYAGGVLSHVGPTGFSVQREPLGIVPFSDHDVWVGELGYGTGGTLHHYNGATWSTVTLPAYNGATTNFGAMSGRASNDLWVAAAASSSSGSSKFALEHWNGTSLKIVAVGPYLTGAPASTFEISPTDVWTLLNPNGNLSLGDNNMMAVHWDGAHLAYHTLKSTPANQVTYGAQLDGTASNNIWAVGNQSVPGVNGSTPQIWRFNGTWQPYAYTAPSNAYLEGVAALTATKTIVTADVNASGGSTTTLEYVGATRFHPVSNNLAQGVVDPVSAVRGTSSFWTLTTSGTGLVNQGRLVTCN